MKIDKSHPRAKSLYIRAKLEKGLHSGFASAAGLLAHGRGEAFDYLLGEKTHNFAIDAIQTAAAMLLLASSPILSINGNTTALVAKEFIKLARLLNCKIEVNLYHHSLSRVKDIEKYLKKFAPHLVLNSRHHTKVVIPNIASSRKIMLKEGIGNSDVILVPLEDGDRAQALISMGKKVITVDLNPLSRTATSSTITIVDNVVRTMPILIKNIQNYKSFGPQILKDKLLYYNNKDILARALAHINHRLTILAKTSR